MHFQPVSLVFPVVAWPCAARVMAAKKLTRPRWLQPSLRLDVQTERRWEILHCCAPTAGGRAALQHRRCGLACSAGFVSPLQQRCPAVDRSSESLTPPASSPLSPTTVLPSSPSSKRRHAVNATLTTRITSASPQVAILCSHARLASPSTTTSRPPGFEASPTPSLITDMTPLRTPSLKRRTAAGEGEGGSIDPY